MNIKTIFFVPARSGSQRIPHKNLSKIGNFSLITIALLKCIKISALNSKVILSTDYSEEELDLPFRLLTILVFINDHPMFLVHLLVLRML